MKITKSITYSTEVEGITVPLTFHPVDHPEPLATKSGDRLIIVYAVQNKPQPVEDLLGDGMGELLSLHRHDKTREQGLEALGLDQYGELDELLTPDKDAVLLDCYIHGSQHWAVSGSGPQCRFDTARGAGVWVPDDCLRSQLDDDEKAGKDRRAQALVYAQQFLEQYNAIVNGEVYGIVTEVFDNSGELITTDSCWGYVGTEDTAEEMKAQFGMTCKEAVVEALRGNMIPFVVKGKTHQIPYEVNDAITAIMQETEKLRAENDKLRTELKTQQLYLTKCGRI